MMHQGGIRRLLLSDALLLLVAIFALALPATSQETKPPASSPAGQAAPLSPPSPSSKPAAPPPAPASDTPHDILGEALVLARKGDCAAAIKKYRQLLEENPKSPDAYAGLTRCYMKEKDVALAYETVTKGLQVADSATVRVALGEVYFRQGKIPEAEKDWVDVINSRYQVARAYLDLARMRRSIMMNKSAKALIEKAHELDPDDPEIVRAWVGTLGHSERIAYYEKKVADESNPGSEGHGNAEAYLAHLKEQEKRHGRSCRLVSKVADTTTPLVRLMIDPKHLRGYGLGVDLNGTHTNIMLDTGASGILVKSQTAEKAGITKLTETKVWGIGDKGRRNAYIGIVQSIRIGQLEFQDCPVEVMESSSVADEDGLIGANVFEDFLVEIDFPNEKLKLSELPKRPGQGDQQLALKNDEDDSDDQEKPAEAGAKETTPPANLTGPQDRYIAPEMRAFTPVYRFGHQLLVPTRIGDAPSKLFLLDTGAREDFISPEAAREVTKVHGDSGTIVKGISGSVKNVYTANKTVLTFGHEHQEVQEMLSFDTTSISEGNGTEVSGFLGFVTLRVLDIKIDYRDALVDFTYDAKRFERR
jgi:predicted aspartyl protease